MTGEYEHTLDAKGRLFIPVKLREKLGSVFYIAASFDGCLSAYPLEMWRGIQEKLDALPLSKQGKARAIFANAFPCELDGQGRVLLPQKLRSYAKLRKNVTIIGVSNHAEIWDADEWNKIENAELTPENIAAAMDELGL